MKVTLPVFPLPIFILPGGIRRIRVFEPRYLKLITLAIQAQGFIISLKNERLTNEKKDWGSWVDIINFYQGKDNVLEIDVKCSTLVDILSFATTKENIEYAEASAITHWSQSSDNKSEILLSNALNELFNSDDELNKLYVDKHPNKPNWVVARWLELLPIQLTVKSKFVRLHNYHQAQRFIQSIIID